jgi:hypothetical protein
MPFSFFSGGGDRPSGLSSQNNVSHSQACIFSAQMSPSLCRSIQAGNTEPVSSVCYNPNYIIENYKRLNFRE